MSRSLRTILTLVAVCAVGRPAAASLRDNLARASETVGINSGSAFDALAEAIAITNANNIPVVSASAGFTYRYNPQLEAFERSAETLGPIFLERPETLGQGKFNVNLSWQYVQYDEYDGQSLGNLQGNGPIVLRNVDAAGNLLGFQADRLQYRLGLQNNIVAFSFTYGILDNLDVNLLLPLIATSLDVGVTRQQVQTAGPDGTFAPNSRAAHHRSHRRQRLRRRRPPAPPQVPAPALRLVALRGGPADALPERPRPATSMARATSG